MRNEIESDAAQNVRLLAVQNVHGLPIQQEQWERCHRRVKELPIVVSEAPLLERPVATSGGVALN